VAPMRKGVRLAKVGMAEGFAASMIPIGLR
jgi:hypothetical protein